MSQNLVSWQEKYHESISGELARKTASQNLVNWQGKHHGSISGELARKTS